MKNSSARRCSQRPSPAPHKQKVICPCPLYSPSCTFRAGRANLWWHCSLTRRVNANTRASRRKPKRKHTTQAAREKGTSAARANLSHLDRDFRVVPWAGAGVGCICFYSIIFDQIYSLVVSVKCNLSRSCGRLLELLPTGIFCASLPCTKNNKNSKLYEGEDFDKLVMLSTCTWIDRSCTDIIHFGEKRKGFFCWKLFKHKLVFHPTNVLKYEWNFISFQAQII